MKLIQRGSFGILLVLILFASSACNVVKQAQALLQPTATPTATATATATPAPTATATPIPELTPEEIAASMESSVVLVRATFPKSALDAAGSGSGTGIVVSNDGYILTNAHVVHGAAVINISLAGREDERPARIVALSACDDLALLRVANTTDLVAAPLGRSAELDAGKRVVALGFPLSTNPGDSMSITSGMVSKKNVTRGIFDDLIQTDATVNPGNSGGPLVNMNGEVIGINTFKLNDVDNMNFAISIDHALSIMDILDQGQHRLWHGMDLRSVRLDNGNLVLVVNRVDSGSPAEKAGVWPGDVLIQFENVDVDTRADVCTILKSRGDGDPINIKLLRFTETETLAIQGTITLGSPGLDDALVIYPLPQE